MHVNCGENAGGGRPRGARNRRKFRRFGARARGPARGRKSRGMRRGYPPARPDAGPAPAVRRRYADCIHTDALDAMRAGSAGAPGALAEGRAAGL